MEAESAPLTGSTATTTIRSSAVSDRGRQSTADSSSVNVQPFALARPGWRSLGSTRNVVVERPSDCARTVRSVWRSPNPFPGQRAECLSRPPTAALESKTFPRERPALRVGASASRACTTTSIPVVPAVEFRSSSAGQGAFRPPRSSGKVRDFRDTRRWMPEMANRPHDLLNQQFLADCDFLVPVFWTRIGSPTGRSVSGTVEEIEEHIGCGKPAMVYFSNAPVRPDRLDQAHYEALNQFRRECEDRGLIETYEGLQDFREKIARQLAQKVIRAFNSEIGDAASGLADAEGQRGGESVIQFLTEEARTNRRQIWTTGAETVPRRGTREQRTSTG